ncbi:MAG: polysaccharide deacetylase family protein [Candidatus Rifleibacteriota bacterium]
MPEQNSQKIKILKRRAFFSILLGIIMVFAACFGFYLGFKQVRQPTLIVLTFHGITDKPIKPWETSWEKLNSIITRLQNHDYKFISPRTFAEKLNQQSFSGRNCLITFDDGLKTSAEAIKRLYKEKQISSAFFILTDFIGKNTYIEASDLKDLQNNFDCHIGLHGKRHYEVTKIIKDGDNLLNELENAKSELATLSGQQITWYSYPFGDYNASATAVIASSSFEFAFTVDGYNVDFDVDHKLIPRIMYLRGADAAKAPSPLDWAPPESAQKGSLTITLSCLVGFISLSWIVRAFFLLRTIKKSLQSQKNR